LARGAALLLALGWAASVHAEEAHSEAAVKAAYLYRFADYVEWPQQSIPGHPFVIEVEGAPDVARELRHLTGHSINDQGVQVREISSIHEVAGARILYVGAGHANSLRELTPSASSSLLIVTDEEHGLDLGGMLNFVTIDNRVRFEISLTAAERAQLKISADLLSVAIRVHGGRRQTDEFCIPSALPPDNDVPCEIRQADRRRSAPRGDDFLLAGRRARSTPRDAGA
jgi:hypothetical protein